MTGSEMTVIISNSFLLLEMAISINVHLNKIINNDLDSRIA